MAIPVLEEILTFLQSIVSWFVQAAPTWMKALISLFLACILGNLITAIILSGAFACTSSNTMYKIDNIMSSYSLLGFRLSNLEVLRNTSINYSSVVTKNDSDKSLLDWLLTYSKCFMIVQNTNWTECSLGPVYYEAYLHPENYSLNIVAEYDGMIMSSGTPYAPAQSIINPICKDMAPRLYLFGKLDIFDPLLWTILTITVLLVPLAIKWYEINHVF